MVEFSLRRRAALRLSWLLGILLGMSAVAEAQIERPVTWTFAARPGAATLTFTASIDGNWHIYSQFIEEGGPEPTSFKFTPSPDYELVGKVTESPEPVKAFEKAFNMNIAYFPRRAVFSQKIRLKAPQTTVKGTVTFMVCNDEKCLPPDDLDFSIAVKGTAAPAAQPAPTPPAPAKAAPVAAAPAPVAITAAQPAATPAAPATPTPADTAVFRPEAGPAPTLAPATATNSAGKAAVPAATAQAVAAPAAEQSLWAIFLAGFVGGLAALLMPCIFPLLPFTVSYFTKGEYSKAGSVGRAAFYGLSIIVIYVALGLLVTVVFGADALNSLATNGLFNLVFFALLVVFAASFLGAFELTLPNSWIAKTDTQADKGGLVGIFFMAATLALVSFSCTGPIIGTLLVQAASTGHLLSPALGMFGFSLALALPFTVFAAFPALLKSLPKSGGWLNSVKVVLGFLELALALKFLSNVDLAYHWEWFDREVFLALWIIIFALLGFYLLGKIRFSHDSPLDYVSLPRLFMAIIVLAFTTYLVPGLWGAPLQAVAGFLPPQHTQDFDLYTPTLGGGGGGSATAPHAPHKYGDLFHAPLGLDAYFDYDEARAYAQKVNKPILIDFTGNACVNCRKMEATVWPDPRVLQRLRHDFVLVQLYVDDKTDLPANEQVPSKMRSGKTIRTIGNKWSEFQARRYNANSQPFYVQLDPATEKVLATPQGANYDPDNFVRFLDSGLAAMRAGRR